MINKNDIALKHYIGLKQNNYLKEISSTKDDFIKKYPISLIGIVSTRKFWEVCRECEIVEHLFYDDDNKYSDFEKEIHFLCEKYMYSEENDYSIETFKQDIIYTFNLYKKEV